MIDLTKLEDYIVIPLTPLADVPDLREFNQPFEDDVAALWSDQQQSVVAFVFDKLQWTQPK